MSGVIDTNVLLYAANQDCPEHEICRAFLERARSAPSLWYLTEGICYEFLRVATHARVFPSPLNASDALSFLEALLRSPRFYLLIAGPKHWEFLRRVLESLHLPSGNLFFDVRTVALMREQGVRMVYSADTDFLQFSDIEVINPLKV